MLKLKTILLAEDNPQDVELTIEALTEHNLVNNVVTVSDGVQAMEYLNCEGKFKNREKGNPAVLLLDIKMPRMDGIELTRQLRKSEKYNSLPIILVTSLESREDKEQGMHAGADAYIVKRGFSQTELLDTIEQLV